jgi:hypothetical protein
MVVQSLPGLLPVIFRVVVRVLHIADLFISQLGEDEEKGQRIDRKFEVKKINPNVDGTPKVDLDISLFSIPIVIIVRIECL